MTTLSRTEIRQGFDMATRMRLSENDSDTFETTVTKMNRKLSYIAGIGVSILVSLIGALFIIAIK